MNYFWIKLKLLSTYPNFSPSFQLYYYFLCPCHQPFFIAYLSLIWWNLLSLSMWLVPVLIVFGLWLNMLCLIWRCWGSLIKWRIIGRGYQRPTYHFRSPHYDHHHLLSCHDHNCYCLLLNNFLWNPRFLLNCAFSKLQISCFSFLC